MDVVLLRTDVVVRPKGVSLIGKGICKSALKTIRLVGR
jgi:hypothetical protein